MEKYDIVVEINYNYKEPNKSVIKTNAKKKALSEILEVWAANQMGKGLDARESNEKDVYTIRIRLDLSNDTFYTTSDTGNAGLTCGIVMGILQRLEKISVVPLVAEEERA